jgi:SAM-dependent methyltransferase
MSFASDHKIILKLQPEASIGGYSAFDGTIEFYGRVKSLVHSQMRVVDFGAGRGAWFEDDQSRYRREMRLLRGSVLEVIGCDVDEAVLSNRAVDRALIIRPQTRLPFEDSSMDMVVADYVFEHIADPAWLAGEFGRILKPGGWICARTPTRYNYVSVAARFIPNLKHARLLRHVQPGRKAEDVFPTVYRLNSRRSIRKYFNAMLFQDHSYIYSCEPQYFFGSRIAYRVMQFTHWLMPATLHGNLYVFLRKR